MSVKLQQEVTMPPELRRSIRRLLAFNVFLLILMAGYAVIRKPWTRTPPPPAPAPVAVVNGQPVAAADLDLAVKEVRGGQVLQSLIDQKLIRQEATRSHLDLDDAESQAKLKELTHNQPGLDVRDAESTLLLRKILLKDVSDSRKHHLYDLFKDDLTRYDVSCIVVANAAEASKVEAALKSGDGFDQVAVNQSRDVATRRYGGSLGSLTRSDIQWRLGDRVAETVAKLREGTVSAPILTGNGVYFVQVAAIHGRYEDLKPAIDDLIANAGRDGLMYHLAANANISSPYLGLSSPVKPLAPPPTQPAASPTVRPAPSASASESAAPNVFAAPSKLPDHQAPDIFAAPSRNPKGDDSDVFAAPSNIPADKSPDIFAAPSTGDRSPDIFAPIPTRSKPR